MKSELGRLLSHVEKRKGGCWVWTGAKTQAGYGFTRLFGVQMNAHRAVYLATGRAILPGHQLHHICNNPACVRPGHMRPLTPRAHLLVGNTFQARNKAKKHCLRGHPFDKTNTIERPTGRACRACKNLLQRQRRAAA